MHRRPLDRAELVARLNRNVDAAAQSQHDGVIRAWAQTRAGLDLSDSALPAALIAGFWREQLALGAGGPRRRPPAAEPAPPVVLSPRTKPSTEAGQVRAWALGVGIDVDPAGPLPRMVRRLHNEAGSQRASAIPGEPRGSLDALRQPETSS